MPRVANQTKDLIIVRNGVGHIILVVDKPIVLKMGLLENIKLDKQSYLLRLTLNVYQYTNVGTSVLFTL